MNALQLLKTRLLAMPIIQLVRSSTEEQKNVIEDLNAEQLERGTNSLGENIAPTYRNPEYARMKQIMNSKPPADIPDLKLTGDFHKSITVSFDSSGLSLEAHDQKAEMLQGKYGDAIIGLSEESVKELQQGYILPELIDRVQTYLKGWKK